MSRSPVSEFGSKCSLRWSRSVSTPANASTMPPATTSSPGAMLPARRATGLWACALRWKLRARGPRNGRGPAPRSRGAGPDRPARPTRWRGGPLQPTGPRLRPTSTDPAPAPCLSCRGLATSTSTHRKVRTNARRGRRKRATRDSHGGDRCRSTGCDGVHGVRLSTEYQAASTRGRPEPGRAPRFASLSPDFTRCRRRVGGCGPVKTRAVTGRNRHLTRCTFVQ